MYFKVKLYYKVHILKVC